LLERYVDPSFQPRLAGLAPYRLPIEAYANALPYVPTGQFVTPTVYRKNIHGIIIAPVVFFWNVAKD